MGFLPIGGILLQVRVMRSLMQTAFCVLVAILLACGLPFRSEAKSYGSGGGHSYSSHSFSSGGGHSFSSGGSHSSSSGSSHSFSSGISHSFSSGGSHSSSGGSTHSSSGGGGTSHETGASQGSSSIAGPEIKTTIVRGFACATRRINSSWPYGSRRSLRSQTSSSR